MDVHRGAPSGIRGCILDSKHHCDALQIRQENIWSAGKSSGVQPALLRNYGLSALLLRLEARFALLLATLALRLPFRSVARWLGEKEKPIDRRLSPAEIDRARAVRGVLRNATSRHTCLVRSLAAHLLLRRRGLPCTVFLGVDLEPGFAAHAWATCGSLGITGRREAQRFKLLASYSWYAGKKQ